MKEELFKDLLNSALEMRNHIQIERDISKIRIARIGEYEGVYIGRTPKYGGPSPLANPFSHLENTAAIQKVNTRIQAVQAYHYWLMNKVRSQDKAVVEELTRLAELFREQGHLTLLCHCSPQRCHGEIVAVFILDFARFL